MHQLILTEQGKLVEVDEKKSSHWLRTDPAMRALIRKIKKDTAHRNGKGQPKKGLR